MILYNGQIYNSSEQENLIKKLKSDIPLILKNNTFSIDELLDGCETIYKNAINGNYDEIAKPLLDFAHVSYETYREYCKMFSKENLLNKIQIEMNGLKLGKNSLNSNFDRYVSPLGVLFHISAGNVDFLPAYTVIEGLLTGNINILKLPSSDNGLSITILNELIKVVPSISQYIYVFDVPSTDLISMKELSALANGIVVWGGDEAISSVRNLAKPNQKLIEWGHKISFAYVLKDYEKENLRLLAKDICFSNQVFCSSCQGIYFDSSNKEEILKFANDFFEILKEENLKNGKAPISARAKNTLALYCDDLEKIDKTILKSDGVSVSICSDSKLELSLGFRNVWVKPLLKENIIDTLFDKHNYLQSCCLIGNEGYQLTLDNLISCGITHISSGDLSMFKVGQNHDGTYPLLSYIKITDIDKK